MTFKKEYIKIKNTMTNNILKEADGIINDGSQEKDRQYGDIDVNIKNMVDLFNLYTKRDLTIEEGYLMLIFNKLARESYKHKQDNLLDLVAYVGALDNYINKKEKLF